MPADSEKRKELKKHHDLAVAFHKCFLDEQGCLTKEGQAIVAFLRDTCQGRGELGKSGSPYFYDNNNRFDINALAFVAGKRAVFDQVMKYLSLDETKILNLIAIQETEMSNLTENLNI